MELAQKILDAHEKDPMEPLEEKSMDLANNRAGMLACLRLREQKSKCSDARIREEFKKELDANHLIVLKPVQKEY